MSRSPDGRLRVSGSRDRVPNSITTFTAHPPGSPHQPARRPANAVGDPSVQGEADGTNLPRGSDTELTGPTVCDRRAGPGARPDASDRCAQRSARRRRRRASANSSSAVAMRSNSSRASHHVAGTFVGVGQGVGPAQVVLAGLLREVEPVGQQPNRRRPRRPGRSTPRRPRSALRSRARHPATPTRAPPRGRRPCRTGGAPGSSRREPGAARPNRSSWRNASSSRAAARHWPRR